MWYLPDLVSLNLLSSNHLLTSSPEISGDMVEWQIRKAVVQMWKHLETYSEILIFIDAKQWRTGICTAIITLSIVITNSALIEI